MTTAPPEQPTAPAAPPAPPAQQPPAPGSSFKSNRVKTIGLIVAGVVTVGVLGALAQLVFGGESDFGPTTVGTGQPATQVSPSTDGGSILDPTPLGSATPSPDASAEATPAPSDGSSLPGIPTEGPSATLDGTTTTDGTDVVTIGGGVQVPVLPGWDVVGQGDGDVLLGDGQNSYVYTVTGIVDPSTDAASVIAASLESVLPEGTYTQLEKTDIAPLESFGSVVSMAGMQYRATWADQQAAVPLQGLLICAVRQDGTAIIITAEHSPPDEFDDSAASWAPVVNETLGL
ncbi:MAG: hypothetical protein ABIO16_08345, partial [Nocardioides sp.]